MVEGATMMMRRPSRYWNGAQSACERGAVRVHSLVRPGCVLGCGFVRDLARDLSVRLLGGGEERLLAESTGET